MSTSIRRASIGAALVAVSVFAFTPSAQAAPALGAADTAPVADSQVVATGQNTPLSITLDGNDSDPGDSVSYTVVSGPTNGSLEGTAAALRKYTPKAGYVGPDSITFKVTDEQGVASNIATVSITVLSAVKVNQPPVAYGQSLTTPLNTAIDFTLKGLDAEGSKLTYLLGKLPANGAITGTAPTLKYTPNTGFTGTDTLTFKVDDNDKQSARATVTFTVAKPNTPPVATPLSLKTVQNRPVHVTLAGTDPDVGDAITSYAVGTPAHGTLSGTAPNLVYTPAKWFHGTDSFTYTVSDGKVSSPPATVTIVVRGFVHKPIAYDQSVTTGVRHPVKIHLNGWNKDRDDLEYVIVDNPEHGRLIQKDDDTVVYVPNKHFTGHDDFRFVVKDEHGNTSKPATVSIRVKGYWGGHHYR